MLVESAEKFSIGLFSSSDIFRYKMTDIFPLSLMDDFHVVLSSLQELYNCHHVVCLANLQFSL